jgi:uncharacterized protein YjbJ (UPF0337 family)
MNKAMIFALAAVIATILVPIGAQAQGTTDKIQGTATELKGAAKETIGKATGDTQLEWSGKADKLGGATQNAVGDVKDGAGGVNAKAAGLFTRLGNYLAGFF